MKRLKIPKRVVLPYGYVVTVVMATDSQMDEWGGPDGVWLDSEDEDHPRHIFLRKRMPAKRKRYMLTHEMGHAYLDWCHYCKDIGVTDS